MTRHVWDHLLEEDDRTVIQKGGFADSGAQVWESRGTGENPLVLVVDVQNKGVGKPGPITEAIEAHPLAMGDIALEAVKEVEQLLGVARDAGVPVMYTRSTPPSYDYKNHEDLQIVEQIAPRGDEVVLEKSRASPFYRTDILTRLTERGIDTVVIVGTTTSGCVRASAVDAQSAGFDVIVPQECVFDRIKASHEVGLLDMWMKYGEVVEREEAETFLRSAGEGE
jgi:nicotinamidase-related amidase